MKLALPPFACCALGALAATSALSSSTSSSAHFTILHAPAGATSGGGPVSGSGGRFEAEVTLGGAFGGSISGFTSGHGHLKHNYIGQLYDIVAIEVAAVPPTINEGGTRQLTTTVELDDTTELALDPDDFVWSHDAGITSINPATGEATAEIVYADMPSQASAAYGGVSSPDLPLTILNLHPDDYLSYGADGIDDDWQVGYYGPPPNLDAAPGVDFDHDGDDNEKEFMFGFSPTDASDFFQVTVTPAADPTEVDLSLNRVIPDRTYSILLGSDLIAYPLSGAPSFSVVTTETDKRIEGVDPPDDTTFLIIEATRP